MSRTTKTEIIKTEASLKDVIWTTLETASSQMKDRPPGRTAMVEFTLNGLKIQCVVHSPEKPGC